MLRLVGDGAYTVMWRDDSIDQARAIQARYPSAPILVRHHCPDWPTTDPAQWAFDVYQRMRQIAGVTQRVVGANEPNLEPTFDDSEARFAEFGLWYERFAIALRNWMPDAVIHFPAFAAGHNEDELWCGLIMTETLAAIRACDRVNAHCYWHPLTGPLEETDQYGGGLRYRRYARLLRDAGISKPIWIDEAGPWAEPWMVVQTAEHARQVAIDEIAYDVEAVTYFLWADPTGTPGNVVNQWYGRVGPEQLEWLREQWEGLPDVAEVGMGKVPDLARACVLATADQIVYNADCAWHLAHGEDKAIDVAPSAGVGELLLVSPWLGLVEYTGYEPQNRGYHCGIADIEHVVDMREFGEIEPWPNGSYDSWLEVGLCHVQGPVQVRAQDTVEAGTLIGPMGWSGKTEPEGPGGRHAHVICWLNMAGDLTFRNWRRIDPALVRMHWGA
jgi:hypothetical protein